MNGTFESIEAAKNGRASNPRVLVVDDDRSNSEIVSRVLAAHGYQVDIAGDGEAALNLVKLHPYRLAVVDYQMPGMNGVELFRRRANCSPSCAGCF